jgi:hypothetical protein
VFPGGCLIRPTHRKETLMSSYLQLTVAAELVLNAVALYFVYKVMPVIAKLADRKTEEVQDTQMKLTSSLFSRMAELEKVVDRLADKDEDEVAA